MEIQPGVWELEMAPAQAGNDCLKPRGRCGVTRAGWVPMPAVGRGLIFIRCDHSVGSHPTQQVVTAQI